MKSPLGDWEIGDQYFRTLINVHVIEVFVGLILIFTHKNFGTRCFVTIDKFDGRLNLASVKYSVEIK